MRYLYLFIALSLLSCNACKEPEPRKPISKKSGSSYKESAERTKKLLMVENELINMYIEKDSSHNYINSNSGFKYAYIKKDSSISHKPLFGNKVLYKYQITNLNNNIIYSEEELGLKTYQIDQENLPEGLRQALKLMRTNETIKCVFPSQLAYGYKGDRKRILPNTPIICIITLLEILTTKEKQ